MCYTQGILILLYWGANMVATRILAPLLLLLCLHLEKPIIQESLLSFLLSIRKACCGDSGVRDDAVFPHGPCSCVRFVTWRSWHARLQYSVLVWHKHGLLTIASSEQDTCLDICICMDVESNPGPDNRFECESHTTRLITYTKQDLLRLRKFQASWLKPMPVVVQKLKMFNLYRYRGCWGGSWWHELGVEWVRYFLVKAVMRNLFRLFLVFEEMWAHLSGPGIWRTLSQFLNGSRTPSCFWICSTKVFLYKYMQSGQNQEQSLSSSGAGSWFE